MTKDEIDRLTDDELLAEMRRLGLEVSHSLYGSIRDTPEELDQISAELHAGDVVRWRSELARHFSV